MGGHNKSALVCRYQAFYQVIMLTSAVQFGVYCNGIGQLIFDEHHHAVAVVETVLCVLPPLIVFFGYTMRGILMMTFITSIES